MIAALLAPWLLLASPEVRLPVVADTGVSSYPAEQRYTYGARSALRIKGIEMFALVKFDLAPLAGRRVTGARYVFKPVQQQFRTLGFSTVAAPWTEGDGVGDATRPGTCFLERGLPGGGTAPWARPGGDFTDVAFTAGHTLVSYDTVRDEGGGWLSAAVDPALIEAMLSGASDGLCVSDETGQTRANNDVCTREQGNAKPYLVVSSEPAPAAQATVREARLDPVNTPKLGRSAARLSFTLDAPAAELTRLRLDLLVNAQTWPRWATPRPRAGRTEVVLDDLPPGQPVTVEVRCGGGRATATVTTRPPDPAPALTAVADTREPAEPGRAFAVPGTTSVHPVTGNVLDELGEAAYAGPPAGRYRRLNPVWSRAGIELSAARDETVAVQLVVEAEQAPPTTIETPLSGPGKPPTVETFVPWYVPAPAPTAELAVPLSAPQAPGFQPLPGRRFWSVLTDVTVPADATPGEYRGTWRYGGVTFPVRLTVWRHTLPPELRFHVSLNSYGRVYPQFGLADGQGEAALAVETAYHRLAHAHRLTWAPLGYGQSGRLDPGAGPTLSGDGAAVTCDWTEYDRRWAPLLDGRAFKGLPRDGVPLDHVYLPLHENWPAPMAAYLWRPTTNGWPAALVEHALSAPPIEQAFPQAYRERFAAVSRAFAEHVKERGWSKTQFQAYLNDKYDFKDPRQGGRGTSWWLLDEPMHRDDWLALAFFGRLFQQGAREVLGAGNLVLRADISRPQWQRDWLDGVVDVEVLGSAVFAHRERTLDWLRWEGAQGWHYATANRPGTPNVQSVGWCLRVYLAGLDGIVPWNSIGADGDYERADPTALLLPGRRFGLSGPVASLRLKALREGEQEVERLLLVSLRCHWTREQLAAAVATILPLDATARQASAEDAGTLRFARLTSDGAARLRRAAAAVLETAR